MLHSCMSLAKNTITNNDSDAKIDRRDLKFAEWSITSIFDSQATSIRRVS